MNLHEYQAKEVLRKYGLPIPAFGVAESLVEAERVLGMLQLDKAVVKIQVHAGGRGKAGGVKIGKSKAEVFEHAKNLIGMKMVNKQTGPDGVISHKVMITDLTAIEKEFYIGALMDRDLASPVLIASPAGGMEIEEQSPDKILKMPFGFDGKLRSYQLMRSPRALRKRSSRRMRRCSKSILLCRRQMGSFWFSMQNCRSMTMRYFAIPISRRCTILAK